MMSRIARVCMVLLVCTVIVASGSQLFAGKPGGGGGGGTGCPTGKGCICAQIYCPVTCNGGCHYSNLCAAQCAGATGCVEDRPCVIEVPL